MPSLKRWSLTGCASRVRLSPLREARQYGRRAAVAAAHATCCTQAERAYAAAAHAGRATLHCAAGIGETGGCVRLRST
jgi:hypothetical protein